MTTKPASAQIVDAIIKDFSDRRGFRQNWEGVEPEIRRVIRLTWVDLAEAIVCEAQAAARRRALDEVADYLTGIAGDDAASPFIETAADIRRWA